MRLEQILGVSQLKSRPNPRTRSQVYGTEVIDTVGDEMYEFKSTIGKGNTEGLLTQVFKAGKNRMEEACCIGLRELVLMCLEDEGVMKYVFWSPSPSVQFARYVDWIMPYVDEAKRQMDENKNQVYMVSKGKKQAIEALLELKDSFNEKL